MENDSYDQDPMSLKTAFEIRLLPRLRTLRGVWNSSLYVVGGLVRDFVREAKAWEKDIDLAAKGEIHLLAQQAADLLQGRIIQLDQDTWRIVFLEGQARWQLDISPLRGEDIVADLKQRDFTINAMALEITGQAPLLIDPMRGQADLAGSRIRWCNPRVFEEDPLRLLRAVRFSAQLGFVIDEETWAGIMRASKLLARVSRERIRDEFFKILSQPESARYIQTLKDSGLLYGVIPGIAILDQVAQSWPHRLSLWEHSLETVAILESILPEIGVIAPPWSSLIQDHLNEVVEGEIDARQTLKFVGLLHDVGKPLTQSKDETGRVRFFGHEEQGRGKVAEICRSLRLGNRFRIRGETLVGSHLRPTLLASEGRLTARAQYRFFRDLGELGIDLLLLGWADLRATVEDGDAQIEQYKVFMRKMFKYHFEKILSPMQAPLIGGRDIMQALQISAGPIIGTLLERIREAEAEGEFQTRAEALNYLEEHLEEWLAAGEKTG